MASEANSPEELYKVLDHPEVAAPVVEVVLDASFTGTSTATETCFAVPRDMRVVGGKVVQSASPDGDKTLKVRNLTDSEDVTDAIDSDALAANTASSFTVQSAQRRLEEDDVLGIVYTVNTAGTTSPDDVTVVLELQLMEPR